MASEEKKKKNNLPKIEYLWQDRKRHLGLPLSFTKYMVSNDRLFMRTGFLNIASEEILLYRVRDIGLTRSLGQRIFGVGTVEVHSADPTAPVLLIRNVKHPDEVKELIHKKVEEAKTARSMKPMEMLGANFDSGVDGDGASLDNN